MTLYRFTKQKIEMPKEGDLPERISRGQVPGRIAEASELAVLEGLERLFEAVEEQTSDRLQTAGTSKIKKQTGGMFQ